MIFKCNASIVEVAHPNRDHFFSTLKITTSKCPISSGLQHTSKIYLLLDFIMEGEILAIVSDCRLIADL